MYLEERRGVGVGGGGGRDALEGGEVPPPPLCRLRAGATCMVYHRRASQGHQASKHHETTPQGRLGYVHQQKQVANTTNTKCTDTNKEPPWSQELPPQGDRARPFPSPSPSPSPSPLPLPLPLPSPFPLPLPSPSPSPSPQQHVPPPPFTPQDRTNRESPEETRQGVSGPDTAAPSTAVQRQGGQSTSPQTSLDCISRMFVTHSCCSAVIIMEDTSAQLKWSTMAPTTICSGTNPPKK